MCVYRYQSICTFKLIFLLFLAAVVVLLRFQHCYTTESLV